MKSSSLSSLKRPKSQSPINKNRKSSLSPLPRAQSSLKIVSSLPSLPSNIYVHIRVRPFISKESPNQCITLSDNKIYLGLSHEFTFDRVYPPEVDTSTVFENSIEGNLSKAIKGYTYTIIAYGQTSSGKTFTMGSAMEPPGIIQHSISYVMNNRIDVIYKISFFEIYMEKINDLLSTKEKDYFNTNLRIRQLNDRFYIENLSYVEVSSYQEAINIISYGIHNRKTSETYLNALSSRSHAFISLVAFDKENLTKELFKINFVDLAGSERLRNNFNANQFNEGIRINSGLLSLSNVIMSLSRKVRHVPYRESKLTMMLKDSFTGQSITTMICCVSPSETNTEETLSTLNYSSFAKKIKFVAIPHMAIENIKQREKENGTVLKGKKVNRKISFENSREVPLTGIESEIVKITKENRKILKENEMLEGEIFDIKNQIGDIETKIKNCADIITELSSSKNSEKIMSISSSIINKIEQLKIYHNDLNLKIDGNERKNNFLIKSKNDELNYYLTENENNKRKIQSKEKILRLSHSKIAKTKNQIVNLQTKIRSKTIEIDSIRMIKMKQYDYNSVTANEKLYKTLILKLDTLYRLKHKLSKQKNSLNNDKETFYNTMLNNKNVLQKQKDNLLLLKEEVEKKIKDAVSVSDKTYLISKLKSIISQNIKCKNRIEKFATLITTTLKTYEEREKNIIKQIEDINSQINHIKEEALSNEEVDDYNDTLFTLEKENIEKDNKIKQIEKDIKSQAFDYEIKLSCLKMQLNKEESIYSKSKQKHPRYKSL